MHIIYGNSFQALGIIKKGEPNSCLSVCFQVWGDSCRPFSRIPSTLVSRAERKMCLLGIHGVPIDPSSIIKAGTLSYSLPHLQHGGRWMT